MGKLINEQDTSTFERAFGKAARLPTEEDRKKAMEQSFRDIVAQDLHRDSAYQPPSQGSPRVAGGGTGWLNEQPLVNADTNRTIGLIDAMCDAQLPTPRVSVEQLRGIDPAIVRQKLAQGVATGKISKAQMEEQLSLLGLEKDG
jgi:hypothetical protein